MSDPDCDTCHGCGKPSDEVNLRCSNLGYFYCEECESDYMDDDETFEDD